ncbi:hypothetical protein PEX2_084890 [Penicillium expansum]|uniref:Uncharacterized protein n=1 Tax=Penicillium expansum TaxID=27334 RepID=A0A0A2K145_PENEN|nr:hypothetical protein PEX2_084890 [Penicillium expansum]KGO61414.1 hypothetical protein PEX2_084890 [Penicillium expansum]
MADSSTGQLPSFKSPADVKTYYLDTLQRKPSRKGKSRAFQKWKENVLQQIEDFLKDDFDINFCDREISTSPLWQATMGLETFQKVLENTTTLVNLSGEDGRTAVFLAVEEDNRDVLERLSKAGAEIDCMDKKNRTPLSYAAEQGFRETVKFLVEDKKADVDSKDCEQLTPLQWAIGSGRTDVIRYLLRKGADVNHRDGLGRTPLLMAVGPNSSLSKSQKDETINLLMKHKADPNSADNEESTALVLAVRHSSITTIRQLLASEHFTIDVNQYAKGRTALSIATELELVGIMEQLIPKANVNLRDDNELKRTPIIWAVEKEKGLAVIKLLQMGGIKVNSSNPQGRTPFSLAAEKGWVDIMQMLLKSKADPHKEDKSGHTGFWWFLRARSGPPVIHATLGHKLPKMYRSSLPKLMEVLEHLEPNRQDSAGRTWLSWAAEYGDQKIVQLLLAYKNTDPNFRDGVKQNEKGFARTPVIWAVEKQHEGLVQWMIADNKNDLSLNYLIREFRTLREELGTDKALHIVKTFISYGEVEGLGFIGREDLEGHTPLHLACFQENEEIVDALLEHAYPNPRDFTGRSCLQYALDRGNERIIRRLLRSMPILEYVQSSDWFCIKKQNTCWVQVYKLNDSGIGFDWKLTGNLRRDQLLSKGSQRIYFCEQSLWTHVPALFDAESDMKSEKEESNDIQYIRKDFSGSIVSCISIHFPLQDRFLSGKHEMRQSPWGIAWIRRPEAEDTDTFLSSISEGSFPTSDSHFFRLFLRDLKNQWAIACSIASVRIEEIQKEQLEQRGRKSTLIDQLAENASIRINVRNCLRSHINRLSHQVKTDRFFTKDTRTELTALVNEIGNDATGRLDDMERASRELLQMELAWVSKSEAASIKRLTWVTFIFLPLMFTSVRSP